MPWLELLTAVTVAVIAVYTVLTYLILRTNQAVVHEMRQQNRALARPYVVVSPYVVARNPVIMLRIENIGRSPATNLSLRLDRPFHRFGKPEAGANLQNAYAFSNPIPSLAPGGILLFYLGMGFQILAKDADPGRTPTMFVLTAVYEADGQRFEESTVVDLAQYMDAAIWPDPVVDSLREIKRAIEKVGR